jgi:hypothetical protein
MQNKILLILVVICTCSCATRSGDATYLGDKNAGDMIQRNGYHLTLPLPEGAFKSGKWSTFEKHRNQDFVANIGLGKSYSWAFSVTIKNTHQESAEALASQLDNTGIVTSVTAKGNASCVSGGLDGVQTTGVHRFYIVSLYCVNLNTQKSFVVSMSEMNILSKEPDGHFFKAVNDLFATFEVE